MNYSRNIVNYYTFNHKTKSDLELLIQLGAKIDDNMDVRDFRSKLRGMAEKARQDCINMLKPVTEINIAKRLFRKF